MITQITGTLNRAHDEDIRIQVGGMEYQVLVAEHMRRSIQNRLGEELSLHTLHFFEGDPSRGKMIPRLVGFLSEPDLDFFELFCTVDGVGTRKALKAMVRPPREIADAIQRQDARWLTSLPGIGASTAEKIVASLKRKVTRFALAPVSQVEGDGKSGSDSEKKGQIGGPALEEAYSALIALGCNPMEARNRLDRALASGQTYSSSEEVLRHIFNR